MDLGGPGQGGLGSRDGAHVGGARSAGGRVEGAGRFDRRPDLDLPYGLTRRPSRRSGRQRERRPRGLSVQPGRGRGRRRSVPGSGRSLTWGPRARPWPRPTRAAMARRRSNRQSWRRGRRSRGAGRRAPSVRGRPRGGRADCWRADGARGDFQNSMGLRAMGERRSVTERSPARRFRTRCPTPQPAYRKRRQQVRGRAEAGEGGRSGGVRANMGVIGARIVPGQAGPALSSTKRVRLSTEI